MSGIDPVLLTKSDHLIRAELQLKRLQIERVLKDQFDKKGRNNEHEDREPHLNVEECLVQAQLRVPHVSGLSATANNSDGAESFDENSYYSSKADSWSSEEHDLNHTAVTDPSGPLTSQLHPPVNVGASTSRPVEPTVIDLDDEAYEPVDDIEIYEPESALLPDETEEEDYSPPPADVAHEPRRGRARERRNDGNGGMNGSRRQSPHGAVPPVQNPRKRRREDKRDGKKRQQQVTSAVASPAEPVIKEEPQSPPAFSAYPELQPGKRRALQPVPSELDLVPEPEDSRMQPVYLMEQEPQLRRYREYEESSSPSVVRVPQRRIQRDDQDLRRVASVQYARRPYSPEAAAEIYAPEPRQMRSASHIFIDRPEMPVYREVSARPSAAPRYVRERSRSPIQEYVPPPQSSMMMAPPPRKIVVDQYGNKYYAAPVDVRESMAPPPSRRMESDGYYQRAVTREPAVRVSRGDYSEEDVLPRMPPPPRRYLDSTGAEITEPQPYRREASHRPIEMEYRPQFEEMGPPREHMPSRAYSLRPEVVRREVPEGYVRHESIQPGSIRAPQPRGREVSILQQEPMEERRYYSVAPQSRRYIGEKGEGVPELYTPRVYARY